MNNSEKFLNYINNAVTPFHAVDGLSKTLDNEGYTKLLESDLWEINKGGKYYVTKNDSSIIAFTIPNDLNDLSLNIVASHTDSPNLRLKPNFEAKVGGKLKGINVEVYGGTINSSWLDRPLGIAGRILTNENNVIKSHLVDLGAICVIPNLAIHQNRTINDGYKYNPATDLRPIYADNLDEEGLLKYASKDLSGEVLGYELSLYNANRGMLLGKNKEFIVAPQIDNLESAYLTLLGFIGANNNQSINIYASFDNEEVGSGTAQGALSNFLGDVIERVFDGLSLSNEERKCAIAKSFLVSCDNAHAIHPNNPSICDNDNGAVLNGGIVIKTNANQLYTTDAVSMAVFKSILNEANVKYQVFANRSDQRGGSTLGHLAVQKVTISSIDIGLPQLAMHSSMETAGSRDCDELVKAITHFYNKHLSKENNQFIIK